MKQLANINRILLFILLIVVLLYWGAPFLIPFIFGIFFAFLMVPLCNLLEKIRLNRTLASLLSTVVVFIVFGGTLFLFITQINLFVSDIPSMEDKIESFIEIFLSAVIVVIQLIESNVLEPLILGKEVKLNPLVIIVAIVVGGLIWGLAGMILFVPIFAIIKIISLNHSGLRPIGFLFGHAEKEEFENRKTNHNGNPSGIQQGETGVNVP